MIIDKNTSDALLVNSIRLFRGSGKPLRKVKLFNTDTMVATKDNDTTEVCTDFGFFIAFNDEESVKSLLDLSLHPKIILGFQTAHDGSASMNYQAGDPEELLLTKDGLRPLLCECSNCSSNFVIFVDSYNDLWGSARTNPTDKHLTVTKLVKSSIVCDNCSTSLHFEE